LLEVSLEIKEGRQILLNATHILPELFYERSIDTNNLNNCHLPVCQCEINNNKIWRTKTLMQVAGLASKFFYRSIAYENKRHECSLSNSKIKANIVNKGLFCNIPI